MSSHYNPTRPLQRERAPLSLDVHRTVEFGIGILLVVLPVVLDYPIGGFVLCFLAGALTVTVGYGATRTGRGLSGTAHRVADVALVALMMVFAVVSAAVLVPIAPALTLVAAAAGVGALAAVTRYVE